MTASGQFGWWH